MQVYLSILNLIKKRINLSINEKTNQYTTVNSCFSAIDCHGVSIETNYDIFRSYLGCVYLATALPVISILLKYYYKVARFISAQQGDSMGVHQCTLKKKIAPHGTEKVFNSLTEL